MRQISQRTRDIVEGATVDGVRVHVAEEVGRPEWEAVADVFTALGGSYEKRTRSYVFETDPTAALRGTIKRGVVESVRATEGYVPTPAEFAEELTSYPYSDVADLPAGARVLEPSAGGGRIVREIIAANPGVRVTALEPNWARSQLIGADEGGQVDVVNMTLEAYAAGDGRGAQFDGVIMNPPFSVPGNRSIWIDHVRLAWDLLRPGGRLVAIVPQGFVYRQDRAYGAIRELVAEHGGFDAAPRGTFAMPSVVLRLTKPVVPVAGRSPYVFRHYDQTWVPVRVDEPRLTGEGVQAAPVQVWRDSWRGGRDRVLRFRCQCIICGWLLWSFDDGENDPRGVLGDSSAGFSLDENEDEDAGPSVGLCPMCANTGERYEEGLKLARRVWASSAQARPAAPPVVRAAPAALVGAGGGGGPALTPFEQLLLSLD